MDILITIDLSDYYDLNGNSIKKFNFDPDAYYEIEILNSEPVNIGDGFLENVKISKLRYFEMPDVVSIGNNFMKNANINKKGKNNFFLQMLSVFPNVETIGDDFMRDIVGGIDFYLNFPKLKVIGNDCFKNTKSDCIHLSFPHLPDIETKFNREEPSVKSYGYNMYITHYYINEMA